MSWGSSWWLKNYCIWLFPLYHWQLWNMVKLISTPSVTPGLVGGILLGYVMYDVTHYYLHHGQPKHGVPRHLKVKSCTAVKIVFSYASLLCFLVDGLKDETYLLYYLELYIPLYFDSWLLQVAWNLLPHWRANLNTIIIIFCCIKWSLNLLSNQIVFINITVLMNLAGLCRDIT